MENQEIDYLEYKQKKNAMKPKKDKKVRKTFWIFIGTFAVFFVLIVHFISHFAQPVDIETGFIKDEDGTITTDAFDGEEKKYTIDKRLRIIYLRETAPSTAEVLEEAEDKIIDKETFETIQENQNIKEAEKDEEPSIIKTEKLTAEPQIQPQPEIKTPVITHTRILVGKYLTREEAELAKPRVAQIANIADDKPFVKSIGNFYAIQVGVYTNSDTAEDIANKFNNTGYNVWIIKN